MYEKLIFYSWQDNLAHDTNRMFLEKILEEVISEFNKEIQEKLILDQATRELPGIPDIVQSILQKIDQANLFIADITTVCKDEKERGFPNSNVMLELGYAMKCLGSESIICFFNTAYGEIDRLPFDIKQRRISTYHLPKNHTQEKRVKQENKIKETLKYAFQLILSHQNKRDAIFEIFKPRIDQIIFNVFNQLNEIVSLKKEKIFISELFEILELSDREIENCIELSNPKNQALSKDWTEFEKELEEITRHPLLIVYNDLEKITSIMKFQREIKIINSNFMAKRFYDKKNADGKWCVKEISILVLLIRELIKSTDELFKSWGDLIMIDPALME